MLALLMVALAQGYVVFFENARVILCSIPVLVLHLIFHCLGASLFDINNPTIELGRLQEPLLVPNEDERDGYVPNVVYSCGPILHGGDLFIPYAVSDYASSFASVPLADLLDEIMQSKTVLSSHDLMV